MSRSPLAKSGCGDNVGRRQGRAPSTSGSGGRGNAEIAAARLASKVRLPAIAPARSTGRQGVPRADQGLRNLAAGKARTSDERNADRAKRTVVRMNHIALGDVDRAGERTGEHDLASL